MRAIRALAVAALVVLDVSAAAAQPSRHFKDSWFWGVKGGGMFYQVQSDTNGSLGPLAGIDWMITRTNGGLYVSFDQTFFKDQFVFVNDSLSPIDTVPRTVFLSGMRRFTLAGMLFPMQTYRVHPYIGFGAVLNQIAKAEPVGTYRSGAQAQLVAATVQAFRASAAPVVIVGTQVKFPLSSVFGQVSFTPANSDFFLFTGNNWRTSFEAGLRYNVGTSIDRTR